MLETVKRNGCLYALEQRSGSYFLVWQLFPRGESEWIGYYGSRRQALSWGCLAQSFVPIKFKKAAVKALGLLPVPYIMPKWYANYVPIDTGVRRYSSARSLA